MREGSKKEGRRGKREGEEREVEEGGKGRRESLYASTKRQLASVYSTQKEKHYIIHGLNN